MAAQTKSNEPLWPCGSKVTAPVVGSIVAVVPAGWPMTPKVNGPEPSTDGAVRVTGVSASVMPLTGDAYGNTVSVASLGALVTPFPSVTVYWALKVPDSPLVVM